MFLKKFNLPFFIEAIKFSFVGVINTSITLLTIFILMKLFSVSYIISNIIGYAFGFINSFVMNKKWTFKANGPLFRETALFIIIFIICYILQLLFLILLTRYIGINTEYSQVLAMIIYTVFNFLGNKFITFKKSIITGIH